MIEDELITMKVFYSYASEDQALRDELEKHLGNLRRQGFITSWSNRNINAGEEWEKVINANLDEADIILLLISSDFIHSDYCYSIELQRALAKQRANEAEVLPILLRHVDWKESLFSHLPVLPANAKPVNAWLDHDEAFVDVVKGIKQVVKRRAGQKCLQRANELLSKQEPEKALIYCEKAIQIDPTSSTAFFLKGDILLDYLKRYGESLIAFRQGSTLEPTNVSYLIKIGEILTDESYEIKIEDKLLKKYDRNREARLIYQQASALEPENVSLLLKTGDSHFNSYGYEEALIAYRRASELEPAKALHYVKIGDVLSKDRHFEEALVAYRRASELEPTNASYFAKIGDILRYPLERLEEALVAYRQASKLEPTKVEYYELIGYILSNLNRYEETISAYQQASVLEPKNGKHLAEIGEVLLKYLHRHEEALAAYRRAFELAPTNKRYLTTIGDILVSHLKRTEEAIEAYRTATELDDPDKAIFYEKIGDIYFTDHEDYPRAIEAYRTATELNGRNKATCYAKIGDVHLEWDEYEEAFAAYRKASECKRGNAEYYDKQAEALERWAKKLREKGNNRR